MSLRALSSLTRTATSLRPITTTTPIKHFTSSARNMGVTKTVLVEGDGPSPQKGDTVTMLYTGWLKEDGKKDGKGKQFDTTEKPGRGPFKTPIGVGRVIQGALLPPSPPQLTGVLMRTGWDEGVVQMKLGEKARLDISSDFAYGSQ